MSAYPEHRESVSGELPHVRRATDELDRQIERNRAEALRHTDGFECGACATEASHMVDPWPRPEPKPDKVKLPNHYGRWEIEPIRFIVENNGPGFLLENATKYPWRYDAKNGHEDLAKTARYIDMLRRYEAGDPLWYDPASPFDISAWTRPDQPLRSLGNKAPSNG